MIFASADAAVGAAAGAGADAAGAERDAEPGADAELGAGPDAGPGPGSGADAGGSTGASISGRSGVFFNAPASANRKSPSRDSKRDASIVAGNRLRMAARSVVGSNTSLWVSCALDGDICNNPFEPGR